MKFEFVGKPGKQIQDNKFYHAIQRLSILGSEIAPNSQILPYLELYYSKNGNKILENSRPQLELDEPLKNEIYQNFSFIENNLNVHQAKFDQIQDRRAAYEFLARFEIVSSQEDNLRKWIKCKAHLNEYLDVYMQYHGKINAVTTKLLNEFFIFKNIRLVAVRDTDVPQTTETEGDNSEMTEELEFDEFGEKFDFDEKLIDLTLQEFHIKVIFRNYVSHLCQIFRCLQEVHSIPYVSNYNYMTINNTNLPPTIRSNIAGIFMGFIETIFTEEDKIVHLHDYLIIMKNLVKMSFKSVKDKMVSEDTEFFLDAMAHDWQQ